MTVAIPASTMAGPPKGRQNRSSTKHNSSRKAVPLKTAKASPSSSRNNGSGTSRTHAPTVSRSGSASFTRTNSTTLNYSHNRQQTSRNYDVDIHKEVRHDVYVHPEHHRHHDYDDDRRHGVDIDIDFNLGFGHRYYHPYRPYRPYRPYYYPYRRPVVVYPARPVVYRSPVVVYEPRPVVVVNTYPDRYKYYIECDGWRLLAEGRGYEALHLFEEQARQYPNAALPRVGTALARAQLHDDYAAAEDMRWAFRRDPGALKYLPNPGGLDRQLYELIDHYQRKATYEPRNNDWHFMLASLNYFRKDNDKARYEIDYIFSYNDDPGYAVKNLNQLVRDAQYRYDN